jgi:hypothetical protein
MFRFSALRDTRGSLFLWSIPKDWKKREVNGGGLADRIWFKRCLFSQRNSRMDTEEGTKTFALYPNSFTTRI